MACQRETSWSGEVAVADRGLFEREVYPVLLMDCAYSQCHGAPQRFFQVYGPGRNQLKTTDGSDSLALEIEASYQRARSMLITDGSRPLSESLLLVKPLDASLGGTSHGGVDIYGRNVYRSMSNPSFLTLVRWALQSTAPATTTPPPPPPSAGGFAMPPINTGTGTAGASPNTQVAGASATATATNPIGGLVSPGMGPLAGAPAAVQFAPASSNGSAGAASFAGAGGR